MKIGQDFFYKQYTLWYISATDHTTIPRWERDKRKHLIPKCQSWDNNGGVHEKLKKVLQLIYHFKCWIGSKTSFCIKKVGGAKAHKDAKSFEIIGMVKSVEK